jgi:hypothetical protein
MAEQKYKFRSVLIGIIQMWSLKMETGITGFSSFLPFNSISFPIFDDYRNTTLSSHGIQRVN